MILLTRLSSTLFLYKGRHVTSSTSKEVRTYLKNIRGTTFGAHRVGGYRPYTICSSDSMVRSTKVDLGILGYQYCRTLTAKDQPEISMTFMLKLLG